MYPFGVFTILLSLLSEPVIMDRQYVKNTTEARAGPQVRSSA